MPNFFSTTPGKQPPSLKSFSSTVAEHSAANFIQDPCESNFEIKLYSSAPTTRDAKEKAVKAITFFLRNLPKRDIKNIFEIINDIKEAQSGWFPCSKDEKSFADQLNKLATTLQSSYSKLSIILQNELKPFLKAFEKTGKSQPINMDSAISLPEQLPITENINPNKENDSSSYGATAVTLDAPDILMQCFVTVMRNDSRIFQVTIPKALAMLFRKFHQEDWDTDFIRTNIRRFGNTHYQRLLDEKTKIYPANPYLSRVYKQAVSGGKYWLEYTLTDPYTKENKEKIIIGTKTRAPNGEYLYRSKKLGQGNYGVVDGYLSDDKKPLYIKKHANVLNQAIDEDSIRYTTRLAFNLQKNGLEKLVVLNHHINANKSIAPMVVGKDFKRGEMFTKEQFLQAWKIIVKFHKCGGLALDNKPDNYLLITNNDDSTQLVRIDLDFDPMFLIENIKPPKSITGMGNAGECPCFNKNTYETILSTLTANTYHLNFIKPMHEAVANDDKYVMDCSNNAHAAHQLLAADLARGQSIIGLVMSLSGVSSIFTIKPLNDNVELNKNNDEIKKLILDNLPQDISLAPHDHGEIATFVANWITWGGEQQGEQQGESQDDYKKRIIAESKPILEFLEKYRIHNNLPDPFALLKPPRSDSLIPQTATNNSNV